MLTHTVKEGSLATFLGLSPGDERRMDDLYFFLRQDDFVIPRNRVREFNIAQEETVVFELSEVSRLDSSRIKRKIAFIVRDYDSISFKFEKVKEEE